MSSGTIATTHDRYRDTDRMRRRGTGYVGLGIRRAGLPAVVLWVFAACSGGTASTQPTPSPPPSQNTAPAPTASTQPPTPSPPPPTQPPTPSPPPSQNTAPVPTTASLPPLAPLAPELVATWRVSKWLDSTGSQQFWRIYEFTAEGLYEYTLSMCRSSTDCTIEGQEWGYAQAANGILTLQPQTESDEGPRGWPYVVGRDPNVGDIQLHLTLSDGQIDIFYRD